MFNALDQFTRAAAAVFRSHRSDANAKANGAAEAWDVDLEAASWKCHAPNLVPWTMGTVGDCGGHWAMGTAVPIANDGTDHC